MSKHEKHVRRERRKTDRTRRQRSLIRNPQSKIQNGAAALAAAAAIAAGTAAYAAPVRFDNPAHGEPGHFHWPGDAAGPYLDVTLPAAQQPGDYYSSQSTVRQNVTGGLSSWYSYGPPNGGKLGVLTATEAGGFYGPLVFSAGDLIPVPGGGTYYGRPFSDDAGYLHYPGYTFLPEGVPTYLGVLWGATYGGGSFSDSQYGWLGVERTGAEVELFAWGYETEPGVAIPAGIPEPGSLALLAFGACAALRRRQA